MTVAEINAKHVKNGVCRHCGGPVPCWSEVGDVSVGRRHTAASWKAVRAMSHAELTEARKTAADAVWFQRYRILQSRVSHNHACDFLHGPCWCDAINEPDGGWDAVMADYRLWRERQREYDEAKSATAGTATKREEKPPCV